MKIAFASLKTKTNKAKLLEKDDRENTHCAISQVTSLFFWVYRVLCLLPLFLGVSVLVTAGNKTYV